MICWCGIWQRITLGWCYSNESHQPQVVHCQIPQRHMFSLKYIFFACGWREMKSFYYIYTFVHVYRLLMWTILHPYMHTNIHNIHTYIHTNAIFWHNLLHHSTHYSHTYHHTQWFTISWFFDTIYYIISTHYSHTYQHTIKWIHHIMIHLTHTHWDQSLI